MKFVTGVHSRLLLRRCLQGLILAVQAQALTTRWTALEEETSARAGQVDAWKENLQAVLRSMFGREGRDLLRLTWLFWRGFALASGLQHKATESAKVQSESLRRHAASFRMALACCSQSLRWRNIMHISFSSLASYCFSARTAAAAAAMSMWARKNLERRPVAACAAFRAWAVRCESCSCLRQLAACRWRSKALAASWRCLSEWARFAGARPVAARSFPAQVQHRTLEAVPGCLADQPLSEAPSLSLCHRQPAPAGPDRVGNAHWI